jgi:DNA-binding SARP family transcriptional activator
MRHGAGDGEGGSGVGALVRAYRRQAGLTQLDLAARAGLSVGGLRDIEQCRRRRPRLASVVALADALGLDSVQGAGLAAAGRGVREVAVPGGAGAGAGVQLGLGLRLGVLGPLEGWRDGVPLWLGPPARRAVLGMLLVEPGRLVRREAMIDVLWGQAPPRTAAGLVQAHVSRLRGVLGGRRGGPGGGVIRAVSGGYRLSLSGGELDVLVFRDLAGRAAAARAGGDDVAACDLYEEAVGLRRGDPLADVGVLSGHPGVTLLAQQLAGVVLRYAEAAWALGQYRRVLPPLQVLAAAEPLNEPAHAWLMIALAGSGQQAAAIYVYEAMRRRLDLELGLYPGDELAEAHLRVLRQDIHAGSTRRAAVEVPGTAPLYRMVSR